MSVLLWLSLTSMHGIISVHILVYVMFYNLMTLREGFTRVHLLWPPAFVQVGPWLVFRILSSKIKCYSMLITR